MMLSLLPRVKMKASKRINSYIANDLCLLPMGECTVRRGKKHIIRLTFFQSLSTVSKNDIFL
jgi:hypothetical protein